MGTVKNENQSTPRLNAIAQAAVIGLQQRFLGEQWAFADDGEDRLRRAAPTGHMAIALMGLSRLSELEQRVVTAGAGLKPLARALISRSVETRSVAELALVAWAVQGAGVEGTDVVLNRLAGSLRADGNASTASLAWSLSAFSEAGWWPFAAPMGSRIRDRLLARAAVKLRAATYGESMHAIAALAHFGRTTGEPTTVDAAASWGSALLNQQGVAGEWPSLVCRRLTGTTIARYDSTLHLCWLPLAVGQLSLAGRTVDAGAVVAARNWVLDNPITGGALVDAQDGRMFRSLWTSPPVTAAGDGRDRRRFGSRVHLDPAWRLDDIGWVLMARGSGSVVVPRPREG